MDKWTTVPASVPKTISPFLARAKELIARDPVVAYWCKFKAAQIALDRIPADNEGREFLGDLMDDLESSKAALAENELVTNDAAGSAYVYNFASRVFDSADATDRDGKATRLTAKEFLAASVFYDVLTIFGPLETEVSEKITYAKWKATSIAKAFREGKVPTPGPANAEPPLLPAAAAATVAADAHLDAATHDAADTDAAERDEVSRQLLPRQRHEEEFSLPSAPADFATDQGADEERPSLPGVPDDMPTSSKDTYDLPSTSELDIPPPANQLPSAPPADDIPARPSQAQPPPQPPSLPPQQPSAPELPSRPLPLPKPSAPPSAPAPLASASDEWQPAPANLDPTAIAASQKHAKWAISALNYEDVETAKKELRLALQLIGG